MTEPHETLSADLQQIVDRYAGLLRLAGSRHGIDASTFDDLLQETRIRLWRASARGETISALPASYLYRTAATAAIDLLRRQRARREAPLDEEVTVLGRPSDAADAATVTGDVEQSVGDAITRLAPNRRPVVRMYLAGYTREEIARQLGWTDGKVRNLLYRGLDDLRTDLRSRGVGPGPMSEAS